MGESDSERPPPPAWIDKMLIEKALRNTDSASDVRVDAATVDYANKDGLGYMSCFFRVVAAIRWGESTSSQQLQLVVKCSHTGSGNLTEMGKENQVFEKEALLLCEVVPEVHRALRAVEGARFVPLAARCYLFQRQPVELLVLDDLSAGGFRLAAAGRPLDFQHCSLVLRSYARLHAASAKLLKDRPEYCARFPPMFTTDAQEKYFERLSDKIFKAVAKELRAISGYEQYAEKYETLAKRVTRRYMEFWETDSPLLNVIMHGDCWKNNFMFKYIDGKPTEIRVLDFQLSRIHGPAGDLVYFLYANASEDVHRHHMDDLLGEYHGSLVGLLRALGMEDEAEGYSLQEFRKDMEAATILAVIYSAMSCFAFTSEKYGADFKDFLQGENYSGPVLENAIKNPYTIPCLKYLAPIFNRKGLL